MKISDGSLRVFIEDETAPEVSISTEHLKYIASELLEWRTTRSKLQDEYLRVATNDILTRTHRSNIATHIAAQLVRDVVDDSLNTSGYEAYIVTRAYCIADLILAEDAKKTP